MKGLLLIETLLILLVANALAEWVFSQRYAQTLGNENVDAQR